MNQHNQDPHWGEAGAYPQAPGSPYPAPPAYPGYAAGNGESVYPPAGGYPQSPGPYPPAMAPTSYPAAGVGATNPHPNATLSPIWQERFAFFQRYGSPGSASKETRQALRAMGLWRNIRVSQNFLAYLFGPIYFAVKGMWRQALTFLLVGAGVVTALSLLGASDGVFRAVTLGFCLLYSTTANYAYFRHVNGERSWNPFAGFWSKKR